MIINEENYVRFCSDKDDLEKRAFEIANFREFSPFRYNNVERVFFYVDSIVVKSGQTFRGEYDDSYDEFPSRFLWMNDEDVKAELIEMREEMKREEEEAKERNRKMREEMKREEEERNRKRMEEMEYNNYLKLKEKYEGR